MEKYYQENFFKKLSQDDYTFFDVCDKIDNYDKDYVVDIVFNYLRRNGFPHYTIEESQKKVYMQKLIKYNHMTLLNDNIINQSMHCLRLAWTYFPHFWEVRCGNSKYTAVDVFNDDLLLKNSLSKTYTHCLKYENNKIKMNRIRQLLKKFNGVQVVSNFRPSAAKVIYELFCKNGVVWDMSSGWGGRLIGALSSMNLKKYIGTEPSTKTYNGLINIKNDFKYLNKEVEIYCKGSEDFVPDKNSLDLCFTSPPYFDTEKYSNELTQSYIKYPTEQEWLNGFMCDTLKNCYYGLKKDGYLALNIANTKSAKNIENGLLSLAKKIGFNYIKTMKLTLSAINGAGHKYEPIYIFRK